MKKASVVPLAREWPVNSPESAPNEMQPDIAVVSRADADALEVSSRDGMTLGCEILETLAHITLNVGDRVLVLRSHTATRHAVVLGRLAKYSPHHEASLRVCADKQLTLSCGLASIDLRADGKVVIKGDDVLVRAKGTKRIRAGSVSIN